jgi:DNA invertase Pin-like site-specific DNA recombinase
MYLRQSRNKTGEELALDRQREDCVALCQAKGWTVIDEYPDDDRSASNGKARPQYLRMLKDIRASKIDAVVAVHQDRLHRDVKELLLFTEVAIEHNLRLATVSGDIDLTTDDGEFMATLGAALARKEVRRKSARQKRANKQMAEHEGRPCWPSRPFGYDADPDPLTGRWWTVRRDPVTKAITAINPIRRHPAESRLLREAYRRFNAGTTVRTIATEWNKKGIKTPRGNTWAGAQVRAVLLSARNAGLRDYGGRVVGKGTWPAIVSEQVWQQAKRKLEDPKRGTGAPTGRKYLLVGIARCGLCGAPLRTAISGRGKRNYACRGCQRISRNADKLDELVTARVVWRLSRPDAVELLVDDEEVDTEPLREERQALNDRLVALGKDFANADPVFIQSALADINGKLKVINDILDAPAKVDIYDGVIGAKDVRKAFIGLDLGRQRTIVDALMTITVNPVGKGTGAVFDPDAIDLPWRVPVKDG